MYLGTGKKQQTDEFVKTLEQIVQKESPVKIKVIIHYDVNDITFNSDYTSIDIYINGFKIKSFGDSYHDDGWERAESYLDGITSFMTDVEITVDNIADYEG